jgi:uncharacterized membrane protein YraQ (UPF0718 family)
MQVSKRVRQSARRTANSLLSALPILLGVLLLSALVSSLLSEQALSQALSLGHGLDALLGAALGSIAAGSPITSYVLGGELLAQGVGLVAVTALLVSWVTVGLVQLPAEAAMLGMRFALWRNALSFAFALLIAWAVGYAVGG